MLGLKGPLLKNITKRINELFHGFFKDIWKICIREKVSGGGGEEKHPRWIEL